MHGVVSLTGGDYFEVIVMVGVMGFIKTFMMVVMSLTVRMGKWC